MHNTGVSTVTIKEQARLSQEDLDNTLKTRFFNDISMNMIFYCFNILNSQGYISNNGGTDKIPLSEHFKKIWATETKKTIMPEISSANENIFNSRGNRILQAICGYQLPTTEDVHQAYVSAINSTLNEFDKVVKNTGGGNIEGVDGED